MTGSGFADESTSHAIGNKTTLLYGINTIFIVYKIKQCNNIFDYWFLSQYLSPTQEEYT